MLLYYDPCFLDHETGSHPEQPARVGRVIGHLTELGIDARCERPPITAVSADRLARVHQPEYAAEVARFAAEVGGYIEADTVVSPQSHQVALKAAGAVCDAVERVVGGQDNRAFCLTRPPGHHALHASAMGFCLFNNVAIAAALATAELQLDRVLIVDWDVHHGNGTQDAFWTNEQVAFFSIHRFPFYPGTGRANETGEGKGLGGIRNIPVTFGTTRSDYHAEFARELSDFADRIKPDLILVSAGFDSHHADPVGSLGLEVEDFAELTRVVIEVANQHADGRIVSLLEGGYNIDVLPKCVATHLNALAEWQDAAESSAD